jgi:hypothetical protein
MAALYVSIHDIIDATGHVPSVVKSAKTFIGPPSATTEQIRSRSSNWQALRFELEDAVEWAYAHCRSFDRRAEVLLRSYARHPVRMRAPDDE